MFVDHTSTGIWNNSFAFQESEKRDLAKVKFKLLVPNHAAILSNIKTKVLDVIQTIVEHTS